MNRAQWKCARCGVSYVTRTDSVPHDSTCRMCWASGRESRMRRWNNIADRLIAMERTQRSALCGVDKMLSNKLAEWVPYSLNGGHYASPAHIAQWGIAQHGGGR